MLSRILRLTVSKTHGVFSPGMRQLAFLLPVGCFLLATAAAFPAQTPSVPLPVPTPRSLQKMAPMTADAPHTTSQTLNNDAATSSGVTVINFKTNDPLGVYSARPILAVGDLTDVNLTSRTITLAIDRSLSSLPHVLTAMAKRKGVLDKLLNRELPTSRTFAITRTTQLMDPARTGERTSPLLTQRQRLERQRLKLEELHPGTRVSVLFRYHPDPKTPAGVLNVVVQPRELKNFDADYRAVPILHNPAGNEKLTTATAAQAGATSGSLQYQKLRPDAPLLPSGVSKP